jgi:hypothetical protein
VGLTLTGGAGGFSSNATNITASDGTLRALAFYQSADATRRSQGKLYRPAGLQPVVNLHPGAIRFLNWNGANSSGLSRWENHIPPSAAGLASWVCGSLPYLTLSGTDQYTLSGVASAGCSPPNQNTPGSAVHGESLVAYVVNPSTQLSTLANCEITGITAGNPTTITTHGACLAVGQTGLTVILRLQQDQGQGTFAVTGSMLNLHLAPVTATFVNSTSFTVNLTTTTGSFGSCPSSNGRANCYVSMYECLNVGGRGCVPIVQSFDGYESIMYDFFGASYALAANTYRTFLYDAYSVAKTDGAGNAVQGAWLTGFSGFNVPMEWQVKYINELNELYPAGSSPTHMWVTIPGRALTVFDSGYTSASDYPVNMYNTIMNGSTVAGVTWPGLCAQCGLLIENSNETWNDGAQDTHYYTRRGYLRFGTNYDKSTFATFKDIQVLASIQSAAAYQANASRTRFVMAGQTNDVTLNLARIFGNSLINADYQNPLNTRTTFTGAVSGSTLTITGGTLAGPLGIGYSLQYSGGVICVITAGAGLSWTVQASPISGSSGALTNCAPTAATVMTAAQAPMMLFQKFAGASYFDGANYATTIPQGANDYTNFGFPSSQVTADITAFVNDVTNGNCAANPNSVTCWQSLMTTAAVQMGAFPNNREAINYEGGLNTCSNAVGCYSLANNANTCNFVNKVYQSAQWANGQLSFNNSVKAASGQGFPAILGGLCANTQSTSCQGVADLTWVAEGCPDTFSGSTEGAGVFQNWQTLGTYNNQSP